ncbi:MAG: hypothetical protein ACUVSX_04765 [Aggregatilineales bacterium]
MQSITERIKPYDLPLALVAFALVALYVSGAGGGFPLDDSWIHQVYARNLAHSGEWAFVPGQPSAASTSPLYTVVLAAGYALGMPYAVWTHAVGATALALTGLLGARMAERLTQNRRVAWAAGLGLVLAWHLLWAAAAGMETMLFSLLTLVLIARAWGEADAADSRPPAIAARGAVFGVVAALAALARPEGVTLAALIGAILVMIRPHGWRGALTWTAAAAAAFGVAIAPYLVLNLNLTGGLLPNTASAKRAQVLAILTLVSYPERVRDMILPALAGGQALLLPGVAWYTAATAARLRRGRRAVLDLLLPAWALWLVLLYAAWLPAPYQHGRYMMPALPALIVCGVVGTHWLLERARRSAGGRVVTRALALAAALVFLHFGLIAGPAVYRRDVRVIDEEMVTAARWIAANIPAQDLLAAHDIGAVGYFAPRPILDIAGLISPEVIPIYHDREALYALMRQRDARYLLAFPDQTPGEDVTDARLCPVFTTGGQAAVAAGYDNMTVYALTWDRICPQ